MWCRFRSCRKCAGDLVLDGEDWKCFQCGRYYYPTRPIIESLPDPVAVEQSGFAPSKTVTGPRRRRSVRDINSAISSTKRSEDRWWTKNREVIRFLDEGRTVKEIATLMNREPRQVRVIRERLNDLRDPGAEIRPAG